MNINSEHDEALLQQISVTGSETSLHSNISSRNVKSFEDVRQGPNSNLVSQAHAVDRPHLGEAQHEGSQLKVKGVGAQGLGLRGLPPSPKPLPHGERGKPGCARDSSGF